jgi:osmotically-inducible protein OsmY
MLRILYMQVLQNRLDSGADSHSSEDKRLEQRVRSSRANRHVPALRYIRVEADGDIVTLMGRVCSFYEKQLSLSAAQRVAGVRQVLDEIRVGPMHRTNPHARKQWSYHTTADLAGRTPRRSR